MPNRYVDVHDHYRHGALELLGFLRAGQVQLHLELSGGAFDVLHRGLMDLVRRVPAGCAPPATGAARRLPGIIARKVRRSITGPSVSFLSAASSSARISASRFRRASAFRNRLRAARHRPLQTSWRTWIDAVRHTGHVREASMRFQQAHVRRPGLLQVEFSTKTSSDPYPWSSEGRGAREWLFEPRHVDAAAACGREDGRSLAFSLWDHGGLKDAMAAEIGEERLAGGFVRELPILASRPRESGPARRRPPPQGPRIGRQCGVRSRRVGGRSQPSLVPRRAPTRRPPPTGRRSDC